MLIEKTDPAYRRIMKALKFLRENHRIPYEWVRDGTRKITRARTYASPAEALQDAAESYSLDFWKHEKEIPFFILEKDALSGIFQDVTDHYRVPLAVARG